VLPGGLVVIESTPWAEGGLVYDLFAANFGTPASCIAARAPTLLMRPDERTATIVEREVARDEQNAQREFFCAFLAGGFGSYLDAAALKQSVDHTHPGVIVANPRALRAMCVDLAFAVNATAAAVVSQEEDGGFVLNEFIELLPKPGVPLKPSFVDQQLIINEVRCRFPNNPRLLGQLQDITAKPKPGGGYSFAMPQRRDGSHGDIASAVIGALWAVEWTRTAPRPRNYDHLPQI